MQLTYQLIVNEDYYSKRLFTLCVMAFARDRGTTNKSISLGLKAYDTNNSIFSVFYLRIVMTIVVGDRRISVFCDNQVLE